jgi:hypothetical protein
MHIQPKLKKAGIDFGAAGTRSAVAWRRVCINSARMTS